MAFLASGRPSTDNIGQDVSRTVTTTRTVPSFSLPDIGAETRNAGRWTDELKSGAAHRSAIGDR